MTQEQPHENISTTIITTNDPGDGSSSSNSCSYNNRIDITSLLFDCATNHLNVQEPFLSNNDEYGKKSITTAAVANNNIDQTSQSPPTTTTMPATIDTMTSHHQHHQPSSFNNQNNNRFTLLDAMAATQLMDPKMDCCQIPISSIVGSPMTRQTTTATATADTVRPNGDTDITERMVYPRPIPTGLDDPILSLPWNDNNDNGDDDLTIVNVAVICIEILIRFQSLLSGSSVGESTFTCLYAHAAVLSDMQSRLCNTGTSSSDHHHQNNNNHYNMNNNNHHHHPNDFATTPSEMTTLVESIQHVTLTEQQQQQQQQSNKNKTNSQQGKTITKVLQWCVFACSYSMVDLTEMVREIIFNADIYEEEDFVSHTYEAVLFYPSMFALEQQRRQRESGSTNEMNDAISDIEIMEDNDDENGMIDSTSILRTAIRLINDVSSSSDSPYIQVIHDILEYELHFVRILPIMARLHGGPELHDTILAIQTTIRTALQRLNDISVTVNTVIEDQKLYDRPNIQRTIRRSFDSYVIRPFVGNVPLRKISFQQPSQSIQILQNITTELDTFVCTLLLRGNTMTRIYRMLDNSIACNANVLCRSILLLNLYFDDKIFGQYDLRDLVSYDMQQWQNCSSSSTLPLPDDDVPDHNNSQNNRSQEFTEDTLIFLNRLAKPIYDTLKVRFLNRSRQRTYIEMVILPDCKSLQHEAQIFDAQYSNDQQQRMEACGNTGKISPLKPISYFSKYVRMILVRFMDRYLEIGMEIGLFRHIVHDMTFAYWYRDYLLSAIHVQLSSMRQTLCEPTTTTTTKANTNHQNHAVYKEVKSSSSSKASHKKKHSHHGKNGKQNHDDNRAAQQQVPSSLSLVVAPPVSSTNWSTEMLPPSEYEDLHELKVISLKRHLCRKTIQYISLLRKVGIISDQSFEFTSLQRIFTKRFQIFHNIEQPPPLTYEDYNDGIDSSSILTNDLIQIISTGYQDCRTMVDEMIGQIIEQTVDALYVTMSISELTSLKKVCVGNIVYIQKLRQLLEKSTTAANGKPHATITSINAKVTYDYDSHCQFCIFKVDEAVV